MSNSGKEIVHKAAKILVKNMHCPACPSWINEMISSLNRKSSADVVRDIDISLTNGTIEFTYLVDCLSYLTPGTVESQATNNDPMNLYDKICSELEYNGFEIVPTSNRIVVHRRKRFSWIRKRFLQLFDISQLQTRDTEEKINAHLKICTSCRNKGLETGKLAWGKTNEQDEFYEPKVQWTTTRIAIGGMTCSSCVSTIEHALSAFNQENNPIKSCNVSLFPPSATVIHQPREVSSRELAQAIEDVGFNAEVVESVDLLAHDVEENVSLVESKFVIQGMTCSSCVKTIEESLAPTTHSAILSVNVTLFPALATIVHNVSDLATEAIKELIEDLGYGAEFYESVSIASSNSLTTAPSPSGELVTSQRKVNVLVDGQFCIECSARINEALSLLKNQFPKSAFSFSPIVYPNPALSLSYSPASGGLNLRKVKSVVESLGFTFSIDREETLESRGRKSQIKEEKQILMRLGINFLFVIPTFVIAVVGMSLVSANSPFRRFWDKPVWGGASCGTVVLFFLATPVQFGVGMYFYIHAWKSLSGVWRKGRGNLRKSWRRVWFDRLARWGSMDSLVALGTSLAYFASLAYMILDATGPVRQAGGTTSYFDTSVFLMFFILAGRYLDAKAKSKTSEAITELGKLRPSSGILYSERDVDTRSTEPSGRTEVVEADYLDIGDVLLVPVGSSPPLDCILAESSQQTSFDESSLTGESRPALKVPGDHIFSGTINSGPSAAIVIIESGQGSSVIDGVVRSVRDAMGRKAGLEKLADQVTAYFVPCVVAVACFTFFVWLLCGYLGALPVHWLGDQQRGSWALFSIQFGIAVLLTACPCGVGLAAPTAQMVGMGLAAKQGILVRGVEAFQTLRKVSIIVFDKTGTLTTSQFEVSQAELINPQIEASRGYESTFWEMLRRIEESSTHPISVGLQKYSSERLKALEKSTTVDLLSSEEIPGRGLSAILVVNSTIKVEMVIGNEIFMLEKGATYPTDGLKEIGENNVLKWQSQGNSIVCVAARLLENNSRDQDDFFSEELQLVALFSLHDPPRPEALYTIEQLKKLDIESYMITGDNEKTARALASLVGIDHEKVIAGVLPVGKRDWIEKLQAENQSRSPKYSKVAFVGDGKYFSWIAATMLTTSWTGINDAPAIAQADAGIAMGSGSTVAISSSDFCLLSSSLTSLLTLHSLANATIWKIITNFLWASLYNVCLIPLAAGAFYAIGDKQTRLPPVYASLAMALSSISVILNSLLLRWLYRPPRSVLEWKRKQSSDSS